MKKYFIISNNKVQLIKKRKPKKITGTRFASVLDKDKWKTPFQTWCEIFSIGKKNNNNILNNRNDFNIFTFIKEILNQIIYSFFQYLRHINIQKNMLVLF